MKEVVCCDIMTVPKKQKVGQREAACQGNLRKISLKKTAVCTVAKRFCLLSILPIKLGFMPIRFGIATLCISESKASILLLCRKPWVMQL